MSLTCSSSFISSQLYGEFPFKSITSTSNPTLSVVKSRQPTFDFANVALLKPRPFLGIIQLLVSCGTPFFMLAWLCYAGEDHRKNYSQKKIGWLMFRTFVKSEEETKKAGAAQNG